MYYIFERLLKERGLRTVDVCKATGISQSTISNWKNRGNMLSPANLRKIAEFFGVTLDYMVGKNDVRWNPQTQEIEVVPINVNYNEEKRKWELGEEEYYEDDDAAGLAEFLHKNPDYKVLFDASKKVKREDLSKALKAIGIFIDEE